MGELPQRIEDKTAPIETPAERGSCSVTELSEIMERSLDVYFVGNRDYIQGSLIISDLARKAARLGLLPEDAVFQEALFRELISGPCGFEIAGESKEKPCGTVRFSKGGDNFEFEVFKQSGEACDRFDDVPRSFVNEVVAGNSIEGDIRASDGFDGVVRALVEATKTLHSKRFEKGRHSLLLGFQDLGLDINLALGIEGRMSVNWTSKKKIGDWVITDSKAELKFGAAAYGCHVIFGWEDK